MPASAAVTNPATTGLRLRAQAAAAAACVALASCSSAAGPPDARPTGTAQHAYTIEVNQSRTNYGTRVIDLIATNNSPGPVTVASVILDSGLFAGPVAWKADGDGTVLPPGQPKSLVTELPEPACAGPEGSTSVPTLAARLELRGLGPVDATSVTDPFGVLERNRAEQCLTESVKAIAAVELLPELQPGATGTATLRLAITPVAGDSVAPVPAELVIERVLETTLLAADPVAPWPEGIHVRPGDKPKTFTLQVRPARCDPHAVAEDKVGTLLPLAVSVGGQSGIIKVAAGQELKGAIHDFVSTACMPG